MTTCIMFTLWAVCAAFSFLRQQAVHFEFRSVSLFRAAHPFWSGISSSRAATNCVERSFSPARLPNVLHESFFIHTYALSLLFLNLQFGPPRSGGHRGPSNCNFLPVSRAPLDWGHARVLRCLWPPRGPFLTPPKTRLPGPPG